MSTSTSTPSSPVSDTASSTSGSRSLDLPSLNLVVLAGTLSRDPEDRTLPSGDQVVSYEVTTAGDDGRISVPVVWHNPPPRALALHAGAAVVVSGRVQRRFFRSNGVTQSRTEVRAERVVPARPVRAVRSLADRAADALGPLQR